MNIFKDTRIDCFAVQHEGLLWIREHGRPKLRQSALKLYLFLCERTRKGSYEVDARQIFRHISLTKNVVTRCRNGLVRLNLITADFRRGQGGIHTYSVLNTKTAKPFQTKDNAGASYFQVPTVILFSSAFLRSNKVSCLIYASLLAECNRLSTPVLTLSQNKLAAFTCVDPETLRSALPKLVEGDAPLVAISNGKIEILDPYTGTSLKHYSGQSEEKFWYVSEVGKRSSVHELLSTENFTTYYGTELPDLVPGLEQQDVRCQFHSDSKPSMSVNLEEGTWFCHACGFGGGIREFEMKKLDTENPSEAWRAICARFGVKLLTKKRGAVTHEHVYRDEEGHPLSRLLRYEDGSGRWYTFVGGKWRLGLGGRKRIPYNLPDVRIADVVIITEGEKKADTVGLLGLLDRNRNPIAADLHRQCQFVETRAC